MESPFSFDCVKLYIVQLCTWLLCVFRPQCSPPRYVIWASLDEDIYVILFWGVDFRQLHFWLGRVFFGFKVSWVCPEWLMNPSGRDWMYFFFLL